MLGEGQGRRAGRLPAGVGVSGDAKLFGEGDGGLGALAQLVMLWRLLGLQAGCKGAQVGGEGEPG